MDRRRFLLISLAGTLAAPLAAGAQAGKVYRIGFLGQGDASHTGEQNVLTGFRQGMRELGYVEGQNLVIEHRWAEMNFDRLPALAAELVQLRVDVITPVATRASLAAKQATRTVPDCLYVDPGCERARHEPCATGRQCHGVGFLLPGVSRQVSGTAQAGGSGG